MAAPWGHSEGPSDEVGGKDAIMVSSNMGYHG